MTDAQKTLANNVHALVGTRCSEIEGHLVNLSASSNILSNVQYKADFESQIKPILEEALGAIGVLRQYSLENLPLFDLQVLILCLTSSSHTTAAEAVTTFLSDKTHTQAALFSFRDNLSSAYNSFYFDKVEVPFSRNKISFSEIMSRLLIGQSVLYSDAKHTSKEISGYKDNFGREAAYNLLSFLVSFFLLCAFLYIEFDCVLNDLLQLSTQYNVVPDNRFYLILLRNIFSGILSLGVFYTLLKLCAIFLHNLLVNRQKSLSLSVFNSFFVSQDSAVRTAAALEAIKTVLGAHDSGVFRVQSQTEAIEVLRAISGLIRGTNARS